MAKPNKPMPPSPADKTIHPKYDLSKTTVDWSGNPDERLTWEQWRALSQAQEQTRQATDEKFQVSQSGEEWDYKTATRGMSGEQLPQGATAWTPEGKPYFGGEFSLDPKLGLFGETVSDVFNTLADLPVYGDMIQAAFQASQSLMPGAGTTTEEFNQKIRDAGIHGLAEGEQPAAGEIVLPTKGGNRIAVPISAIPTLLMQVPKMMQEPGQQNPTILGAANRALGFAGGLAGEVLQGGGKAVETGLGVGQALGRLAEGSPLPAVAGVDENGLWVGLEGAIRADIPEWSPDHPRMAAIQRLPFELNPFLTVWNAIRFAAAPGTAQEKLSKAEKALQSARIAGSGFFDLATRAEFEERYAQDGEDPYLLALELGNPLAEMGTQMALDPLNWMAPMLMATKAAVGIADAEKALDAAGEVARVFNRVGDINQITDAAQSAQALADLARATQTEARAAAAGLDSLARSRGLFSLTGAGKRTIVGELIGKAIGSVFSAFRGNPDEAIEVLNNLVKIVSANADEVAEGTAALAKSPLSRRMFSPLMLKTGVILRSVMADADGVVDVAKFTAKLKEQGDVGKMIAFAEGRMAPIIAQMFPDVTDIAGAVDKIAELEKAGKAVPDYLRQWVKMSDEAGGAVRDVSKIHRFVQDHFVRHLNTFLGGVYMGLSPAYAVRNWAQNMVHAVVDYGVGILKRPAKASEAFLMDVFSFVPEKAGQGIGAVGGLTTGVGRAGTLPGIAWSQKAERSWSMRIFAYSVEQTLGKLLNEGKAIPSVEELVARGMSRDTAAFMVRTFRKYHGDVVRAAPEIRAALQTGSAEAFRGLEWLDAETSAALRGFSVGGGSLWTHVRSILKDAPDMRSALKSLRALRAQLIAHGDEVYKEGIPIVLEGLDEGQRSALVIAEAKRAGVTEAEALRLLQARIQGNQNAVAATQRAGKAIWMAVVRAMNQLPPGTVPDELLVGLQQLVGAGEDAAAAGDKVAALRKQTAAAYAALKKSGRAFSPEADALWTKYADDIKALYEAGRDAEANRLAQIIASAGQIPGVEMPPIVQQTADLLNHAKALDNATIEAGELVSNGVRLVPPFNPVAAPTEARAVQEQLASVMKLLDAVEEGTKQFWGAKVRTWADPSLGADIEKWMAEAGRRGAIARQTALEVASRARDFTLLNYGGKTYFDAAAAYVYPYQFWYSRTYVNWARRIAQNPALLANYAAYRTAMERLHAGMPEWWRYNVNSGEMLGLDPKNGLFFNLEAFLNPLNGLTGVDFNDKDKRSTWATALLNDMNLFGPNTWTPFNWAVALALYRKGDEEAAAKWAGRLIPQTATLKSMLSLLPGRVTDLPLGGETDLLVNIFSGGLDPYERNRVGATLAKMIEEGLVSPEDAYDAGVSQQGDIWDAAVDRATNERAVSKIFSQFAGVGWKARTEQDVQIDMFWQDYRRLLTIQPDLSPEEKRQAWDQLRQAYPFMETILISRKGGDDRTSAIVFNAFARVPPGMSDDVARWAGIPPELVSKFYDEKGDISDWADSDKQRLAAGAIDIIATLALPADATRTDWTNARIAYDAIVDHAKLIWGDDIWDRVENYLGARGTTPQEEEKAKAILMSDPDIEEALDYKTSEVMQDPILAPYYSSITNIRKFWEGIRDQEIADKLGQDIWIVQAEYNRMRIAGEDYRGFAAEHPELKQIAAMKEEAAPLIAKKVVEFGDNIRDVPIELRPGAGQTYGSQGIVEGIEGRNVGIPQTNWSDWQALLGPQLSRLIEDYSIDGEPLPDNVMGRIYGAGQQLGISGTSDYMLEVAAISARGGQ